MQALDEVDLQGRAQGDRRPARRQRRGQVDADQGAVGRRAGDQRRHLSCAARRSTSARPRRDRARDRDDLPGFRAGHAALDRAQPLPRPRADQGAALPQPDGHGAHGAGRRRAACKRVGIGKAIPASTPISSLSGGERQAVAIARAMHFDSDLIILDEPTNNLGVAETQGVLRFVRNAREFRTFVHLHRPQHPSRVPGRRPHRRDAAGQDRRRRHRPEGDFGRRGRGRDHRRFAGGGALRVVIARSGATKQSRGRGASLDCFASLAMTGNKNPLPLCERRGFLSDPHPADFFVAEASSGRASRVHLPRGGKAALISRAPCR